MGQVNKTTCQSVQPFLHSAQQSVPLFYNGPLRLPQKFAPSPRGSGAPSNTWYLGSTRVTKPNGILIGSAIFAWVPNAMLHNALSTGKKTPKTAPSPWDYVTLPNKDQVTAIGYMHKNFGKIARVVLEISSWIDRHIHTQICVLQQFTTTTFGVTIQCA